MAQLAPDLTDAADAPVLREDAPDLAAEPVEAAAKTALARLLRVAGRSVMTGSARELRNRLDRLEALAEGVALAANGAVREILPRVDARIDLSADALTVSLAAAAPGGATRRAPDPKLVALPDRAEIAALAVVSGEAPSSRAIARDLGRDHRDVAHTLKLARLAPDIADAIRAGDHPPEMTLSHLKRPGGLPLDWSEQRRRPGLPEPG